MSLADRFRKKEDQTPTPQAAASQEGGGISLKKAAGISLKKYANTQRKWAVYLDVDGSPSMAPYVPKDVEFLVEAVLTATQEGDWDDDGIIPSLIFGREPSKVIDIKLGEHSGAWGKLKQLNYDSWGTAYAPALRASWEHYKSSDSYGKVPALMFFQTDGQDGSIAETRRLLSELSGEPVVIVIVGYGDEKSPEFEAARSYVAGSGYNRTVQNVFLFVAGRHPHKINPVDLFDGLLVGPSEWLQKAPAAGVVIP